MSIRVRSVEGTPVTIGEKKLMPEATILTPIVESDKIAKMGMCVGAWSVFWLTRALIKIFGQK